MNGKDFFNFYIIVGLFINAALSAVVSYVAQLRGRSAASFFALSFLLSFLVGILVLIALPGSTKDATKDRVSCPFCDESISQNAKICQFCKSDVAPYYTELKSRARMDQESKNLEAEGERVKLQAQSMADAVNLKITRQTRNLKIRKSPITKIVAATVVIIATSVTLVIQETGRLADLETLRIEGLTQPNCSIAADGIEARFDSNLEIIISLPSSCGQNLNLAIEEGLLDSESALGQIVLEVFLDGKLRYSSELQQAVDVDRYQTTIPNSAFYTHAAESRGAATELRVEAHYRNSLQKTEITRLGSMVPKRDAVLEVNRTLLRATGAKVIKLNYASFQVADRI